MSVDSLAVVPVTVTTTEGLARLARKCYNSSGLLEARIMMAERSLASTTVRSREDNVRFLTKAFEAKTVPGIGAVMADPKTSTLEFRLLWDDELTIAIDPSDMTEAAALAVYRSVKESIAVLSSESQALMRDLTVELAKRTVRDLMGKVEPVMVNRWTRYLKTYSSVLYSYDGACMVLNDKIMDHILSIYPELAGE